MDLTAFQGRGAGTGAQRPMVSGQRSGAQAEVRAQREGGHLTCSIPAMGLPRLLWSSGPVHIASPSSVTGPVEVCRMSTHGIVSGRMAGSHPPPSLPPAHQGCQLLEDLV